MPANSPLKIFLATSELTPLAKTGGLADVVDALSRALGTPQPGGPGHEDKGADVERLLPGIMVELVCHRAA